MDQRGRVGRAGLEPDPADNPYILMAYIHAPDPNEPPVKRLPRSRTIARLREKAEAATRAASAALAQQALVQQAFRPTPGKIFSVDAAGLVLIGPAGALGSTIRMIRTLAPLATGGRHSAAVLMSAGEWQDEAVLGEALDGMAGKLAALGLRICRKKAGLRMAKVKPVKQAP